MHWSIDAENCQHLSHCSSTSAFHRGLTFLVLADFFEGEAFLSFCAAMVEFVLADMLFSLLFLSNRE